MPVPNLMLVSDQWKQAPLGSGEGVIDLFRGFELIRSPNPGPDGKDKGGRPAKIAKQVRNDGMFTADEGEAVTALTGRTGSTLGGILRSACSGDRLGSANVLDNQREAVRYALGLVAGFQPALLRDLLNGGDVGTPQRFYFASALDPSIPDAAPAWPGTLSVTWPVVGRRTATHRRGDGLLRW